METAFIVIGCVLFSTCLIVAIISIKNLISARKTIKEAKSKESKIHFAEVQLNTRLKECYKRIDILRKALIKSFIDSAKKYNFENGLDFCKKETVITNKITEMVKEAFSELDVTQEDIDDFDSQLEAFTSLYNNVLSIKAFAITLYFSLDLEVMQSTCNYKKNIDTIMDFISESINNPEFDNFTTNDIKNYLKNKFNQPSF